MPYFIDEKNCVHKGTKDEPGEMVKCHEDHAAAVAHLRALYANVEDAGKGAADLVHADASYLPGALRGEPAEKIVVRPVEMVLPSGMDAQQAQSVAFAVLSHLATTDKGGRGSGWHNPPEGTHTAENAPNFAGGPGADRTYGTESDEPPEGSKLCKCTKCSAVFTLPKGKQCGDFECPACGGRAEQESPRKDKPAEGEEGDSSGGRGGKKALTPSGAGAVHGEGSMLGEVASVMDDGASGDGCKCPKCGEGLPCTAKACPHCKESIEGAERVEDEKRATKAEGDGQHPAGHYLVAEDPEKPSTWHLRVRNAKGELDHTLMGGAWAALHGGYPGNKYEGPNKEMALAKLKKLYEQEGMDTPGEKSFTSYKSATGEWRWLSISNWAVVDREAEVVSERAYRDAIAHAQKANDWGQLDLVHVDGTDVGDCDTLFVLKGGDDPARFGAGGTWYDTEKATRAREAIQAESARWGVSLKFRFNPDRLVRGVYTGDIQVLKHSILPQKMAASYGTAIAVQGVKMSKQLDAQQAEALRNLGQSEEDIVELAEKAKDASPEENVVEKEDATTERNGRWAAVRKALSVALGIETQENAPDASEPEEARKTEEVAPVTTAEPAETEKAEGGEPEAEQADASALMQALGESIGKMVKEQLDGRDKRITDLEEQVKALAVPVEEKVEQLLRNVPPVVKVAASQVAATIDESAPKGLTFGKPPGEAAKWAKAFVADVVRTVEEKAKGAGFQV